MRLKGARSHTRSLLSDRYQCTRRKSKQAIRIRIVCRGGSTNNFVNNNQQSHVADDPNVADAVSSNDIVNNKQQSHAANAASGLRAKKKPTRSKSKIDIAGKILADKAARAKAIELSLVARKNQELNAKVAAQQTVIKSHEGRIDEVCKKLSQSKKLVEYYKGKNKLFTPSKSSSVTEALELALSKIYPGKHAATKAKLLVDEILSGRLFEGEAKSAVDIYIRSHVRELFKPWRVLKAGDVSPIGAFKTSTVKALNDVIDEKNQGLFPSPTSINRARALLDDYAFQQIGYERRMTKYGEVYFINFEKALRFLLKACHLHDLATKEPVKISLAIDGADLFHDRTHVSAGVKITDERGYHPVTKQPLFVRDDDGEEKIVKIQSSEMCCFLIIADARDNKSLYEDVFKEFYQWGDKIQHEGLPASNAGPALFPFKVTHCADLKGSWYLSNRGGGCKNKEFFCTLCTCTKHTLTSYKTDDERCDRCKGRQKKKCYHHAVCDSVTVPFLLQCLEEEVGNYFERHGRTFAAVREKSKLRTDPIQVNKEEDIQHIDYSIPDSNEEKLREYTQFISRECRIRSIPLHGRLDDWRTALRRCVVIERYIASLEKVKKWNDDGRETIPLVEIIELLIPCILHCENRVGEKIITIILRRELDRFVGRKIEFIKRMEYAFQTAILGSESSHSQWKLKHTNEKDGQIKLDAIQVRNQVVRKMISKIDVVVETAVPDTENELRGKIIYAVNNYKEGMALLTLHRALSCSEKQLFQDKMDDFFETWIDLFGEEGVTNYIHLLGSGHMLYFLEKYDCLYMYSQQGWEDLNNRCQAFLLHNSSRGGFGSGEGRGKSYTFPLVRYIMRDLLWKTGEADIFFQELLKENNL